MKKPKRNKRIISISLIVIAALLAIGSFTYFAIQRLDEQAKNIEMEQANIAASSNNIQPEADITSTDANDFDYDALGVQEYQYPSTFELSDDLSGAIALLAQSYNDYNSDVPRSSEWQEFFTSHYLMNSHYSFGYLNFVCEQNSNKISEAQAEYMSYALTGVKSDFTFNESLDYNNASSFYNDVFFDRYTFEQTTSGVLVHAVITQESKTFNGDDVVIADNSYSFDINLVKNPYSCFSGYSISSIKFIADLGDESTDTGSTTENATADSSSSDSKTSDKVNDSNSCSSTNGTSISTNTTTADLGGAITSDSYLLFKKTCDGPKSTSIMQKSNTLLNKEDYYGTWFSPSDKVAIRLASDGAYVYYPLLDCYGDQLCSWEIIDRSDRGLCPMMEIHCFGDNPGLAYYIAGKGDGYFYGNSQGFVFYRQ